jgi:H+/Cl- antiporter ClcA
VLAAAIGVANGLVFLGFEYVTGHGTDWLWDDVVHSDESRWRVLPLAIGLSIALSALVRALKEPRWNEPHVDPLGSADDHEPKHEAPATLSGVAVVLVIGAASLLVGASLGPEASLVAAAVGMGAFVAARANMGPVGKVLVVASVGALLVAFLGSLITLAIPLLLVYQRTRKLPLPAAAVIVIAGLSAYGTLWLVQGSDDGYGSIPSATVHVRDYFAAALLGAAAVWIGALLRGMIARLGGVTRRIDSDLPWWVAAALFGAVLGLLYLVGGRTIEFSGSEGSRMLLSGEAHYGTWALLGLALAKLLATSWSLSAGYRGGLVFPTVYVGIAISLFVASAASDLAGPGVLLGSVAGLLVDMTAPLVGAIMLLALLPAKLLPLGLVGVGAAVVSHEAPKWIRSRRGRAAVS